MKVQDYPETNQFNMLLACYEGKKHISMSQKILNGTLHPARDDNTFGYCKAGFKSGNNICGILQKSLHWE